MPLNIETGSYVRLENIYIHDVRCGGKIAERRQIKKRLIQSCEVGEGFIISW